MQWQQKVLCTQKIMLEYLILSTVHCEEHSDAAISNFQNLKPSLLRSARNDSALFD